MNTSELKEAVKTSGKLTTALHTMAYEGLVLRLAPSVRSDRLQYVATEAWLGTPLDDVDPDAALAWLAAEYLRAFGPARIRDFAWWAGVTQGRARAAFETVDTLEVGGSLLLGRDQQNEFENVRPLDPGQLTILPIWDAYTMGYAGDGRQRLIDDAHLKLAFTPNGDGMSLILRGGRAVAWWLHKFTGDRMKVSITHFESNLPLIGIEASFEEIGRMLGATSVDVTIAAPGEVNFPR
jgi:hypothetical protein